MLADGVFRVGDWTAEPGLHQISSGGRTVKIEPKAMAVLSYLAEHHGQVVTRQALLSSVWAGLVVGDDALTQVVVKLRRALGDLADEPVYIQTIQKGGYRLVAPVVQREDASPPLTSPRNGQSALLRMRAAAGAAIVIFVAAGLWLLGERTSSESPERLSTPADNADPKDRPTVAVAPFEALGNDPREAMLARAIGEDLVTDLSKMPALSIVRAAPHVASTRTTVPGSGSPVRYRISGTVHQVAERMRLYVHLSDAQTGKQLWSERFERESSGLFEIQDELAPKILHLLPVKLGEAELRRVSQRYTRNLEAYETFQRGRSALYVRRKADNEVARELFRQAIGMDAAFARAYAGLAMTYTAEYRNQWVADPAAALDRALELARTAHRINPEIPETYWVLAFVHSHKREHDRALQYLKAAVRLFPSFAEGYALMGGIYTSIGRPAEGLPGLHAAMRLDPESGYPYFTLLGRAYFFLGELELARINLQHALSRNPEFIDARVYMAAVEWAAGERDAAMWEVDVIRTLQPEFTTSRWLETNPLADAALRDRLVRLMSELGL